jgi:Flp pilus assembly protein TadB
MNYKYLLYFLVALCMFYYVKTPDTKMKMFASIVMIILALLITAITIKDNRKRRKKIE